MPNDYECMLFCSMSSNREARFLTTLNEKNRADHQDREKKLSRREWKPYPTSKECNIREHGYFGVAYYKLLYHARNPTAEIVIAHRGTCFDEKGNILADIAIAKGEEPKILREAAFKYVTNLFGGRNFYNGSQSFNQRICITENNTDFEITKITHTGFSLGGFIAGACAALTAYPITEAVTFDAPGIGIDGLAIDKARVESRIINYVTVPNLVNTCNSHIGKVRQMIGSFGQAPQSATTEFDVNFFGRGQKKIEDTNIILAEVGRTIKSHNLNNIIESLKITAQTNGPWYYPIYQWPTAENVLRYMGKSEVLKLMDRPRSGDSSFSMVTNALQDIRDSFFLDLWDKTNKSDNQGGKMVGLGGIHHERNNTVYYTREAFLLSLQAHTQGGASSSSTPVAPVQFSNSAAFNSRHSIASASTLGSTSSASGDTTIKTSRRSNK